MLQIKKLKLSELCAIQTGYTARARLDPLEIGGVRVVQLRDLQGNEAYDPADALTYGLEGSLERYRTGAGDVLFRSRGERNEAVAIEPEAQESAVAIMPLMILRPDKTRIDPAYLAWFINQSSAQRHFDECAQGSRLRMIPKPCLEALEVPLPDLATQLRIVALDALAKRERTLLTALADKRAALSSSILLKRALHGTPPPASNQQEAGMDSHASTDTMKG